MARLLVGALLVLLLPTCAIAAARYPFDDELASIANVLVKTFYALQRTRGCYPPAVITYASSHPPIAYNPRPH